MTPCPRGTSHSLEGEDDTPRVQDADDGYQSHPAGCVLANAGRRTVDTERDGTHFAAPIGHIVNRDVLSAWSDLLAFAGAVAYGIALIAYAVDLSRISSTSSMRPRRYSRGEVGRRTQNASDLKGRQAPGRASLATSDDAELGYQGTHRLAASLGVAITMLAFALHLASVIARGAAAERVPWGNLYEYFLTGSMMMVAVYLAIALKRDIRFLGVAVTSGAVLMLCAAAIGFPTPVSALIPALQSPWIVIHVSIAALGSAVLAIDFLCTLLSLIKRRTEVDRRSLGRPGTLRLLADLPSRRALDKFAYRLNTIGFVMWTFTLIAGAIWAEQAWGRYWGWDPKEVWTFITWVIYAAYLHASATRGWNTIGASWIALAGFVSIAFNSLVVNSLFSGLHSYSGM